MNLHVLMVLPLGLCMAPDGSQETTLKKELKRFQGPWRFVSLEVERRKTTEEDLNKRTVVLKDDQWTVSAGDKIEAQSTFTLDPARKPKEIDLIDAAKGRRIRGIYSLDGDKLTVCDRGEEKGDRPTEFATRPDSGLVLIVLQRVQPAGSREDAAKKDREELQGTWKFVSMEINGEWKPDRELKKYKVVLEGDRWSVSVADKLEAQSTFTLDPARKPKEIDLVQRLDPDKGRRIRGIYSLDGDKLTVCDRGEEKGERPTEFASKRDSGLVLVVLERLKP